MAHPANPAPAANPDRRITLIDALRGSALAGLFMVHCVEHFELTLYPENRTPLMQGIDDAANTAAFFLFSGKAYAIFAMMFGVSFVLLLESWTRKGVDVRTRFPWRLALLGAFGYLNGLLYSGDILLVLAVLGLPLVLVHRWPDRAIAWLSAFFLLQVPTAWTALQCLVRPDAVPAAPLHWEIFGVVRQTQATGSLGDVLALQAGRGQLMRLLFTYETGRYLQMLGLFGCGLLLARHHVLEAPESARRFGRRALAWGLAGVAVFLPLKFALPALGVTDMRGYYVGNWVGAYANLAQMAVWVGGFVLLYLHGGWRRWLDWFTPLGRMSLSCYVAQEAFFVPFFYGYGLGLYRHLGQFHSVLCGLAFLAAQAALGRWWLRRFQYGPLEWLWRAGTMLTWRTPLRRRAPSGAGGGAPEASGEREVALRP